MEYLNLTYQFQTISSPNYMMHPYPQVWQDNSTLPVFNRVHPQRKASRTFKNSFSCYLEYLKALVETTLFKFYFDLQILFCFRSKTTNWSFQIVVLLSLSFLKRNCWQIFEAVIPVTWALLFSCEHFQSTNHTGEYRHQELTHQW